MVFNSIVACEKPIRGDQPTATGKWSVHRIEPVGGLMETYPPRAQFATELAVQRSRPKLMNDTGHDTTSPASGGALSGQLSRFILKMRQSVSFSIIQ